jgi:hypothetical protein
MDDGGRSAIRRTGRHQGNAARGAGTGRSQTARLSSHGLRASGRCARGFAPALFLAVARPATERWRGRVLWFWGAGIVTSVAMRVAKRTFMAHSRVDRFANHHRGVLAPIDRLHDPMGEHSCQTVASGAVVQHGFSPPTYRVVKRDVCTLSYEATKAYAAPNDAR